jgi:Flp pilus assembly pilin Flp
MRIASVFAAAAAQVNELKRFADDFGGSLIEYALVAALVAAVAVAGLTQLQNNARTVLSSAAASISA